MKDIQSKVRASLSSALDDVQGRSDIESIRRRAGRQRNALIAGGLTATVAVAILASSLLGGRSSPTIVAEPPHGASTFGRYAIELGHGFARVEGTGIVEIDVARESLCVSAAVNGVTSLHLHRDVGDGQHVILLESPEVFETDACYSVPSDSLQPIVNAPYEWYVEFHNGGSGGTIRSDLEPISNLPDPEAPCDLLEEDEMSAAAGVEINGSEETLSRDLGDGERVPLCTYAIDGPEQSLTVSIKEGISRRDFRPSGAMFRRNAVTLDDVGDDAYIYAKASVSVRVDDVAVTASVQDYRSLDELALHRLGAYIARELREHSPTPAETPDDKYGCDYPDLAVTAMPWGNEGVGPGPSRSRHYTNVVWRPPGKHRPGDPYLRISRTDVEFGGVPDESAPGLPDGSPGYLYRGEGPDSWAIQWEDFGDDGCHTEMQLVLPGASASDTKDWIIRVAASLIEVPFNGDE